MKVLVDDNECDSQHPKNKMYCTRKKGHKGNHIAMDGKNNILAEWNGFVNISYDNSEVIR